MHTNREAIVSYCFRALLPPAQVLGQLSSWLVVLRRQLLPPQLPLPIYCPAWTPPQLPLAGAAIPISKSASQELPLREFQASLIQGDSSRSSKPSLIMHHKLLTRHQSEPPSSTQLPCKVEPFENWVSAVVSGPECLADDGVKVTPELP